MDIAGVVLAMVLFLLVFDPEGGGQIAAKVYKGFQTEMASGATTKQTIPPSK